LQSTPLAKAQKEEKRDKFRRDLKARPAGQKRSSDDDTQLTSPSEDQQFKTFLGVEREKRLEQKRYADELLQVPRAAGFIERHM
jgi:hypothetical protein